MDDIDGTYNIPHVAWLPLIEVASVIFLFGLAMSFMGCALNGPRGCEGCCCFKLWKKLTGSSSNIADDDADDDDSSYIEDAESGRPAPHVFESLNELVFFEGPNNKGVLETSQESELMIPTSMDKIFPDLLGPEGDSESKNNDNDNDLREPLL